MSKYLFPMYKNYKNLVAIVFEIPAYTECTVDICHCTQGFFNDCLWIDDIIDFKKMKKDVFLYF